MASSQIPDIVISRLPLYLRTLSRMLTQEGIRTTSSYELGQRLGISSAQIRKDLSHFGEFGKQGTGYQTEFLIEQLRRILKVDREWGIALVGLGDLGRALAHYNGFASRGFRILLVFDNDPAKIGSTFASYTVYDIEQVSQMAPQYGIKLAMVSVPAEAAQAVTDKLVAAGIQGILNYAPITLKVPAQVQVQYIDPVVNLQHMTYYL